MTGRRSAASSSSSRQRRVRPLRTPPAGEWIQSPNYTPGRPAKPDRILLHHMAGSIGGAIARFSNPNEQASAHYLLGWVDARRLVEMVHPDDTAWHAGVWAYNQRAIGIETETDPNDYNLPRPDTFYEDAISLVAALCREYSIPPEKVAEFVPPGPVADHRDVWATYCPGTLDTDRIRAGARRIIDGAEAITGPSQTSAEQVRAYLQAAAPRGLELWPSYPETVMSVAAELGVRAEVMVAQAVKETGAFQFAGTDPVFSAKPEMNNVCGIKTADGSATASFASIELGLVAQAAHLAWYSTPAHVGPRCSQQYDPRHFGSAHKNTAHSVAELGGKWAPSLDYGTSLVPRIDAILATQVGGGDVGFDPKNNPDDEEYLKGLIRKVVMNEDIAAYGVTRTLERAVGVPVAPPPQARPAAAPEIDPHAGHGPGIPNPPRGPRRAARPSRLKARRED